jgi:hypothetical protein
MLPFNAKRQAWWQAHLNEGPWLLDEHARRITLEAICSVCDHRQWGAPERMLSDFKAYVTRALRREFPDIQRRRYWAQHGSTRYLWNDVSMRAAISYVLKGQGEAMACYSGEPQNSRNPYYVAEKV